MKDDIFHIKYDFFFTSCVMTKAELTGIWRSRWFFTRLDIFVNTFLMDSADGALNCIVCVWLKVLPSFDPDNQANHVDLDRKINWDEVRIERDTEETNHFHLSRFLSLWSSHTHMHTIRGGQIWSCASFLYMGGWSCMCFYYTLSEIKVQKLSLGRYLFKRYTFVPIKFKYVYFKY